MGYSFGSLQSDFKNREGFLKIITLNEVRVTLNELINHIVMSQIGGEFCIIKIFCIEERLVKNIILNTWGEGVVP